MDSKCSDLFKSQMILTSFSFQTFSLVVIFVIGAVLADNPPSSYQQEQYPDTPAQYNFQWQVKDDYSQNDFGQQEERDGDNTSGSYYVQLPDGRLQKVTYKVNGYGGKIWNNFPITNTKPFISTGSSFPGYEAEVTYEGEAQYDQAPAASSYQPRAQAAPQQGYQEAQASAPSPSYQPAPKSEPKYEQPAPKPAEPKYQPAAPASESKYSKPGPPPAPAAPKYLQPAAPAPAPAQPKYQQPAAPPAPSQPKYEEPASAPAPRVYYKPAPPSEAAPEVYYKPAPQSL